MESKKYQNKYRVASARAGWWDYGTPGAYFITICTHRKLHYFGRIVKGKMHHSPLGVLADVFWHEILNHAKNVTLGAFVVMPNHIHGILILNETIKRDQSPPSQNQVNLNTPGQNRFQNQGKNTISSIVGSYKSAVTKHANRLELEFEWQERFHDHIIRDDPEYQRINDYIESNPANWDTDRFSK